MEQALYILAIRPWPDHCSLISCFLSINSEIQCGWAGLKTNTADKTQGGAGCCQPERIGVASFLPNLQCILAVSFVGSLPKNELSIFYVVFLLENFCKIQ